MKKEVRGGWKYDLKNSGQPIPDVSSGSRTRRFRITLAHSPSYTKTPLLVLTNASANSSSSPPPDLRAKISLKLSLWISQGEWSKRGLVTHRIQSWCTLPAACWLSYWKIFKLISLQLFLKHTCVCEQKTGL